MLERIYLNWVYGGAAAAVPLLMIAPILGGGVVWTLTFLALPVYMIHQLEEHNGDRFRLYVNEMLGEGYRGLDHRAVFVINFFGVWVLIALTLWLMALTNPGWAAITAYLLIINAIVHVIPAIALRRYNPGLVTAVVLFLPLGVAILRAATPSLLQNVIGIALIVALHAVIVLYAREREAPT